MLLVIFGAGASYDSAPRLDPIVSHVAAPWRPPLTDNLFDEREEFGKDITNFPMILPIVAQLTRALSDQPLEKLLARLAAEADEYPLRRSQLVAFRYFLQQLIWECDYQWQYNCHAITNYLGLLDRIERWRRGRSGNAMFVTFNYDRLFEYAASHLISDQKLLYESKYATLESYVEEPRFPLLKLHGSIDWGYRVNTPLDIVAESGEHVWSIAWEVITRFESLDVATEITKTDDRPPKPQGGHAFLPAIAIPLDKKTDFACPQSHLDFLEGHLPEVDSILAVGWRGMEEHFLGRLSAKVSPNHIMTVCGNRVASQETIDRLSTAGIASPNVVAFDGGFSTCVPSLALEAFLRDALKWEDHASPS